MGIITLLAVLGAGFTGIATVLGILLNGKNDKSPKVGSGFFEAFVDAFKKK